MGKVTKKVKRGLESSHWHSQPASFAQTSKLAKETGKLIKQPKLCTWEIKLTKKEASDLIGRCVAGDRAEVRAELIEAGCELWVRADVPVKAKPKATTPPKTTPASSSKGKGGKRTPPKKTCTECGEEVYAIHTKDGVCKACQKSTPATPAKTERKQDIIDERDALLAQIAAYKAEAAA